MGNKVINILKKDEAQVVFLMFGLLIVPMQQLVETIIRASLSKQISALVVISSCISFGLFSTCKLMQGDNTKRESVLDIICIIAAISIAVLLLVVFVL